MAAPSSARTRASAASTAAMAVAMRPRVVATAAVLGEGKLEELGKFTGGKGRVPSAAKPKTNKARERFEPRDGASKVDELEDDSDDDDDE